MTTFSAVLPASGGTVPPVSIEAMRISARLFASFALSSGCHLAA
jgi:hypothetical protein